MKRMEDDMTDFTADDWWKIVDDHWNDFLECFDLCGAPMGSTAWNEFKTDGFGYEMVEHELTLERTLWKAKEDRDHATIHKLFNICWAAAPDKPYIHSWPSWGHLCDVCSEYPVAFEEELRGAD